MAAPKPKPKKVNDATQAVRDARAVAKAAGEKYTRKPGGEIKVNAKTQARRLAIAKTKGTKKMPAAQPAIGRESSAPVGKGTRSPGAIDPSKPFKPGPLRTVDPGSSGPTKAYPGPKNIGIDPNKPYRPGPIGPDGRPIRDATTKATAPKKPASGTVPRDPYLGQPVPRGILIPPPPTSPAYKKGG